MADVNKPARPILFVVGNSRSGTTMLGRMLGMHVDVHTFGELHFFEQLVAADAMIKSAALSAGEQELLLAKLFTRERRGLFSPVNNGAFLDEIEQVMANCDGADAVSVYLAFLRYETEKNGGSIPCEQTPRYIFLVEAILNAIPNARVINLVRDPRDVLLSQKNKWRRRFLGAHNIPLKEALRAWANYHPYLISRLWRSAVEKSEAMASDERFLTIRFESLLENAQETLIKVCHFGCIEFQPAMLQVPQSGSSTGRDDPNRLGVDAKRLHAWRKGGLSAREISTCQRVAGDVMVRQGYELTDASSSLWMRVLDATSLLMKGGLAFLLNLNRSKNLVASLRSRFG